MQPTVPQALLVGRVMVVILSARVEISNAAGQLAAHSLTPFGTRLVGGNLGPQVEGASIPVITKPEGRAPGSTRSTRAAQI